MTEEEQMLFKCSVIASTHFNNGEDCCCNFSFEEKNVSVKLANLLRGKGFKCYIHTDDKFHTVIVTEKIF